MSDKINTLGIERNRLRQAVIEWMDDQGKLGKLRANRDAPMWFDYEDAERALAVEISKLGTAS